MRAIYCGNLTFARRAGLLALVILISSSSGCNIVAPVAYALTPPAKKAAEYEIADRPTVVYVDDRIGVLGYKNLRRTIADAASGHLLSNEVLTRVISSRDALAAVDQNDRHSAPLPIDEIGRMVGAEQIIYVEMKSATPTLDGYTPRPAGVCTVRLIDVTNQTRLYPPEGSEETARTIQVIGPQLPPGAGAEASRLESFTMLANQMGLEIAELFYKHKIEKLGTNLNPR